ncbi:uncharacterized protein LOC111631721 [Centruroides sculpturatus]|uniref:uncharacterized protein LOC111631721 n=1 Tax=Centruroides sculpturatus TaxID=218467 RepID=UPI000C6EFA1A|nr:uncharacterized protein LOC111631721 [Centruroides sculpturatus]
MPYRCCVTGCKGNYPTGPKVQVFSFPKEAELAEKWKRAIPRDNLIVSKTTKVCEQHFHPSEIVRTSTDSSRNKGCPRTLVRPSLLPTAVPSIFPNCPKYLSKSTTYRESPQVKRQKLEEENLQKALQDSLKERENYMEARKLSSLSDLQQKLSMLKLSNFWNVITSLDSIMFLNIDKKSAPVITYSVVVNEHLDLLVFLYSHHIKDMGKDSKFVTKISNVTELVDLLELIEKTVTEIKNPNNVEVILNFVVNVLKSLDLSEFEKRKNVNFIIEQMSLIISKKIVYSPSFMIFSCLLHSISPCAYKFIRQAGFFISPHPCTIRKVCSNLHLGPQKEQCEDNFLSYVNRKYTFLQPHEYYINLLIDEIHLKEYFDYKNGNLVGMSNNNTLVTANAAQVFMIASILSNFKDVAHILGVNKVTGNCLHQWIRKIILGLEEIGFKVVSVISDNNAINRKAMSLFADPPDVTFMYKHPKDMTRTLFYVIDPVHIMKCIWHNWLKQREQTSMVYPTFEGDDNVIHYACFDTLLKMYDLEHDKLAKYCHGLSLKALRPNAFEKQNVKLVLQIFNDLTSESLLTLGPNHLLPHYRETAVYINIFVKWWKIVNVKTPGKGNRLNDDFMCPITDYADDIKIVYLKEMLQWLEKWKKMNISYPKGSLTKETHLALTQTTEALIHLSKYCLSEMNCSYFLPGKFQTDLLEDRFGQYRQLSGGQYNISIRQVYEVEKKLRLQSVIRLNLKSDVFGAISFSEIKDVFSEPPQILKDIVVPPLFNEIYVTLAEIENYNEDLPILTYIAGYCCYSVLKKLKCEFCKDMLVLSEVLEDEELYSLITNVSRGKLLFPQSHVISVVVVTYLIMKKICEKFESDFLKVQNQRELVTCLTLNSIVSSELLWEGSCCENFHFPEDICKKIVWISTNIFLNNYCRKKNQTITKDAVPRKKKIFSKSN